MSSQWGWQKLFQGLVSHELTAYLFVFDLFLTPSNFVDRESFLESNSLGILALCETSFDESIDSRNLSVRSYLPLIQKDSIRDAWSYSLCEGRTSFGMGSRENSEDSYIYFWLPLLYSVSYFFSLYRWPSSSLCTAFDSISSNIDPVLWINPSVNVMVCGEFNVHYKDWLTYFGGSDRLVNFVIIFLSFMTLLRLLTFRLVMFLSQFPLTFNQTRFIA